MSKEKQSALERAIEELHLANDDGAEFRDRIVSSVWYDLPQKYNRRKRQKYYILELLPDESQKDILEQNFDGYTHVHDYYTQELQKMRVQTGELFRKYGRITSEILHKDARGASKTFLKKDYVRDYERTSIHYAVKNAYNEWKLCNPCMYKPDIDAKIRCPEFYVKNNAEYSRIVVHDDQIRLSRNLGHFHFRMYNSSDTILGIIEKVCVYRDIQTNRYFAVLFMLNPDEIRSKALARKKDMPETLDGVLHNCDLKAKEYSEDVKVRRLNPDAERYLRIVVFPGDTGLYIIHENDVMDMIEYPKHALRALRKYQKTHSRMKQEGRYGETNLGKYKENLEVLKRKMRSSIHNAAHHLSASYMYEAHTIILYTFPTNQLNNVVNLKNEFMYPYFYNTYANEIRRSFRDREGRYTGRLILIPSDKLSLELECPNCGWSRPIHKGIQRYGNCPLCKAHCDIIQTISTQMLSYANHH